MSHNLDFYCFCVVLFCFQLALEICLCSSWNHSWDIRGGGEKKIGKELFQMVIEVWSAECHFPSKKKEDNTKPQINKVTFQQA